jgi:Tfp pilus assembly protein PilX
MATYTPPPYFPQSSLSPPDENRYRKFKLIVAGIVLLVLAILGIAVTGAVYLIKWLAA